MTFSIQHNPYLSMYQQLSGPPLPPPPTDCALPRKPSGFRQSLPSRLQTLPGLDLVNSLLASYRTNNNNKSKSDVNQPAGASHLPYPPINPLLASPSWFQHALMNSLGLPRPFVDDSCSLPLNPLRPPPPPPAPDTTGSMLSPKLPRLMAPSPVTSKSRNSSCDSLTRSEKEVTDPLLYCRSTFYPLLKDQVDRAHSSWRTSDAPRPATSDPIQETGTLVPSLIDGEVIMGFNVWGEKRLCLPHLFRFVLNDVDLKAIDEACTKLQITCTTCTPAQLKLLHSRRILPKAVSTCGLIRKSDAERLTKFLRNRTDPNERSQGFVRLSNAPNRSHSGGELEVVETDPHEKREDPGPSHSNKKIIRDTQDSGETRVLSGSVGSEDLTRPRDSSVDSSCPNEPIPVLHECFGRQSALIHPQLYTEPTAKCIECQTCHRFFAPDQFVGHTHTVTEVDNLNHWGFDSNNWRCYLRLHTSRRREHRQGNSPETSEDEMDVGSKGSAVNAETHRRLEEFKIKFAQPIRLPPSLSAALRTVGLCASVAPIPPTAMFAPNPMLDQSKAHPPGAPTAPTKSAAFGASRSSAMSTEWSGPVTGSLSSPLPVPPPIPSNLSSVLLPQLTLRRLWAPNDGRIKVPPPPKPLANRDQNVLPKKLHTGPPLLLHSHRVVSQEAAEQYDRDFIPNVCLMPTVGSKCRKSSCSLYGHRHRLSHGCSCKHSRNLSSGSRSRSCSSGSSSSRTRSVSISSTTSSCYSQTRSCKRYCDGSWRSPCSPASRSSSTDSSVQVDEIVSPSCAKKKRLSLSSTWSDSSTSRPLDHHVSRHTRRSRRRCRSASAPRSGVSTKSSRRLLCRRIRSASPVLCPVARPHTTTVCPQHLRSKRVSKTSICSVTSCTKDICSPISSEQSSKKQCRNRALAAAKAAQGAASRISPGLWSRHFTNLRRNNGSVLELPNARQPFLSTGRPGTNNSASGLGTIPLPRNSPAASASNTPVLVTGPNTNSLPAAVLALEAIWADLVRHINEYTSAVESGTGVQGARQRLLEQFLTMQTCYATHIAALMSENQKLHEKLASFYTENSDASKPGETCTLPTEQQSGFSNWSRNCSTTQRVTGPRPTTDSYNAKESQAPLPLYPHRSRKEPQPSRTHFSTPCGPVHPHSSALNRRFQRKTRTPDERLCSADLSEPVGLSQSSHLRPGSESIAERSSRASSSSEMSACRERVVDSSTVATSSLEDPSPSPLPSSVFKPIAGSDVSTGDSWSEREPSSSRASNNLDSLVQSHSLHSSSSAPYKVSSGLCNRRLSEKYNTERIPWKRRAWDFDGQHESNGSLDLSVQSSSEPTPPPPQKRRTVNHGNAGCEDSNRLSTMPV